MPTTSKRSIFRDKALHQYLQSREKNILPRFVAPPVFVLYWILLAMLLVSGLIAWFEKVPLYATGAGIIPTNREGNQAIAIIFLPASSSSHPQPGLPALVQINPSGSQFNGTVSTIEPGIISPSEAKKRYSFEISTPSLVVTVKLGTNVSSSMYAGSLVNAQVQVGSQRLLSLFPVFDTL